MSLDGPLRLALHMRPFSIDIEIENLGAVDIYLFDRLWKLDLSNSAVAESTIYTYVRDGYLRFLAGAPPVPRIACVAHRVVPHVSLLSPGNTLSRTFSLPDPLREHSEYFPEVESTPWDSVQARGACAIVRYVEAPNGIAAKPSRIFPDAFVLDRPVAMADEARTLCSGPVACRLDALRRRDELVRPTLPWEAEEPFELPTGSAIGLR